MSTLVRELNSEGSDQEDGQEQGSIRKPLEFDGDNEDEDEEEEDRWGDELCNRYDQESQFLSARTEYENINNDYSGDSSSIQQPQGRLHDDEDHSNLDDMMQLNGRRR